MKKFFKWLGIILGVLLIGAAITVFVLVSKFNSRMERTWDIAVEKVTIPTDSASIANGRQFAPMCQSCHGEALEGKVFFTDPKIGTIYSPNLTSGEGGKGKIYTDEDWVRALRHGMNPQGKSLFVMPSYDFNYLGEQDLAELIAYIKSVPPVDNTKGENIIPTFTKILMQIGAFGDVFSSEVIKHDAPFPKQPERGTSKEYGEYMVNVSGCKTCHSADLSGGKSPDPLSPPVSNITPAGNISKWTSADFIKTIRTGITPEKKEINDKFMPWKHYAQYSDDDLTAIFNHLKSVPAKETKPQ